VFGGGRRDLNLLNIESTGVMGIGAPGLSSNRENCARAVKEMMGGDLYLTQRYDGICRLLKKGKMDE
jgi:hypothetical protein